MINVQLVDIEDVKRRLQRLEKELQYKAVSAGLTAVVRPIRNTARSLAPVRSGDMARAIGRSAISKRAKSRLGIDADIAIIVGPNRRIDGRWQGKKGHWQEFGTEKSSAQPFLLPALEANQSEIESSFYRGLENYLNKIA